MRPWGGDSVPRQSNAARAANLARPPRRRRFATPRPYACCARASVALRLLTERNGNLDGNARRQMASAITRMTDPMDWGRTGPARVTAAIMQHVRALTHALPDWWRLEVITVDFDRALLGDVRAMLRDVQRGGPTTRWAHTPEPAAELRARCGRAAHQTV